MDPKVALVTATNLPVPDPESHLVVEALAALGVPAAIRAWSDPWPWEKTPLVVLRSPWDYHKRLDEFLAWAERVSRATRLLNPFSVVSWNARKGYLLDLESRGVPVVPTRLLRAGTAVDREGLRAVGEELVVKPAVAAGAYRSRVRRQAISPAAEQHVDSIICDPSQPG